MATWNLFVKLMLRCTGLTGLTLSLLQHQKLQKKLAKRDQAAQAAAQHDGDISKVCQVLELQSLMDNLSEDVRVDFLNGTNGAVVS